jgi:hypothetical protein
MTDMVKTHRKMKQNPTNIDDKKSDKKRIPIKESDKNTRLALIRKYLMLRNADVHIEFKGYELKPNPHLINKTMENKLESIIGAMYALHSSGILHRNITADSFQNGRLVVGNSAVFTFMNSYSNISQAFKDFGEPSVHAKTLDYGKEVDYIGLSVLMYFIIIGNEMPLTQPYEESIKYVFSTTLELKYKYVFKYLRDDGISAKKIANLCDARYGSYLVNKEYTSNLVNEIYHPHHQECADKISDVIAVFSDSSYLKNKWWITYIATRVECDNFALHKNAFGPDQIGKDLCGITCNVQCTKCTFMTILTKLIFVMFDVKQRNQMLDILKKKYCTMPHMNSINKQYVRYKLCAETVNLIDKIM